MHFSKHIAIGCLLATTGAVIGGLGTPIAKALLTDGSASPLSLSMLRIAGTALVFWTLPSGRQYVKLRHLGLMLLIGTLGIAPQMFLFNYGLHLSFPIEVSIINSCSALWVVILGTITRQIARARYLRHGTLLTAMGMMITIFFFGEEKHNLSHISGNGIAMVSMLVGGLCTATTTRLPKHYNAATIYKWIYTFALVPEVIYCFVSDNTPTLHITSIEQATELIYVCIITGAASIILHSQAQRRISTKASDICSFAQPFAAMIVAYNIGFDTLTWFDPIAIVIIFISYLIATGKRV